MRRRGTQATAYGSIRTTDLYRTLQSGADDWQATTVVAPPVLKENEAVSLVRLPETLLAAVPELAAGGVTTVTTWPSAPTTSAWGLMVVRKCPMVLS